MILFDKDSSMQKIIFYHPDFITEMTKEELLLDIPYKKLLWYEEKYNISMIDNKVLINKTEYPIVCNENNELIIFKDSTDNFYMLR